MKFISNFCAKNRKLYALVYITLVMGFIFVIMILTESFDRSYLARLRNFSDDWITEDGVRLTVSNNVRTKEFDGTVIVEKSLPQDLTDNDSLCFESGNANVTIWIGDEEVYSFVTRENITGLGYGIAFHEVGLSRADARKPIKIKYYDIYEGQGGARIANVYIGPAQDYIHLKLNQNIVGAVVSVIIIFFGLMLIFTFMGISNGEKMPFDITSLGVASYTLGSWLFIDTNVVQIVAGHLFTCRVLSRVLVFLAGFPLISFFNSLTEQRKKIYYVMSIIWSLLPLAIILVLRYTVNLDFSVSFSYALAVFVLSMSLIIVILLVDNSIYCRKNGVPEKLKTVFLASAILLGSGIIDLILFFNKVSERVTNGTFTRVGAMLFIAIMIMQFLSWWTRDQESIGRDRFVNRIMQYAVSSDSFEKSLESILECLGENLKAGRVIIFEDQKNGKYHGTYEWAQEGRDPAVTELLYLPYEGLIDNIYAYFKENDRRIIVDNVEDYKAVNLPLYSVLKTNNVKNMVACPLEENDKMHGIISIFDLPGDMLDEAEQIVKLTSYFVTQLLERRDEDERLKAYIYNDALTGAQNRRAYREFINGGLDISSPFGYVACEITGLEKANSMQGYDSGDRMVIQAASHLIEVFGQENVFRISGRELAAFGFETEELFFNGDVERFKKLVDADDISVSIGAVYCIYGTRDINMVINRANFNLREDRAQGI